MALSQSWLSAGWQAAPRWPAIMNRILAHIDRITRHRDRILLDASIVQALGELTGSDIISLYCLMDGSAEPIAALAARHDHRGLVCWSDDDPERPEVALAADPLLGRCHAGQSEVSARRRPDGTRRYVFPLANGDGLAGLLEFVVPRRLTKSERQLIRGFSALHRNFLDLLEYSQIDALTGLLNRKTFDDNLDRILRAEPITARGRTGGCRGSAGAGSPAPHQGPWPAKLAGGDRHRSFQTHQRPFRPSLRGRSADPAGQADEGIVPPLRQAVPLRRRRVRRGAEMPSPKTTWGGCSIVSAAKRQDRISPRSAP